MRKQKEKKRRRASSLLTGMILLVLILGVGVQLYRMQDRVEEAKTQETALAGQIAALEAENAALAEDIANADNPELIEQIAREELGMVVRDEKVFYHIG
jgi:cell division protein FtsL